MPSSRHDREMSKAEADIRKIVGSAEQRCIALGSRYSELTLTEEQLLEVEDELRKARMFEVMLTGETMRAAEVDELKRRMLESERAEETKRQRNMVSNQLMKQRAIQLLQAEADSVKREEEKRLADDRRLVLQREKEKLISRRRHFEAEQSLDDSAALGGGGPSSAASGDRSAPVLVMNVALGNGKEDRVVVRRYDDPKRVALLFAKKHHLPDNAVSSLTQQIRANLHAAQQREAQQQSRHHQATASSRELEPNPLSAAGPPGISPIHPRMAYDTPASSGRRSDLR